jgi:integrase/recombinase XerD
MIYDVTRHWMTGTGSRVVDDERLISLWLHGKSENTCDAYFRDIIQFSDFVDKPFADVTLSDVQAYDLSLVGLKPSSRARKLSTVKSLLSFGHQIGYLRFNVGGPIRTPPIKNTLSERILDEEVVLRLVMNEPDSRNRLILSFLYYGGLRVSELCGLTWSDLKHQRAGLQVTVFGKGGVTRTILLPHFVMSGLQDLEGSSAPEDPVFANPRTGKALHRSQVYRIVRKASRREGLSKNVSPHWLRHAHASHALDNGAPSHLVQQTLGHKSLATTGRYAHARPKDSSSRYIRPAK